MRNTGREQGFVLGYLCVMGVQWEHGEGQDPDGRVVWDLGERLGLRYKICVKDLGVIDDIKELDENCQGIVPQLAGEAYYR